MRELKFRAWGININEYMGIPNDPSNVINILGELINRGTWIIEQYTGLKDKNGKEIYEGDIVKVLNSYSSVYQCNSGEWILPHFYKEDDPISSLIFHCDKGQIEVVGNIHQNPELIGEEQ